MQGGSVLRKSFKATDRDASQRGVFAVHGTDRGCERTDGISLENLAEPLRNEVPQADSSDQAIFVASKIARGTKADYEADRPSRSKRKDVVLFLPGPVTEYDLLMDSMRRARSRRKYKARRRRIQWLKENIGALIFVTGLLTLTWFVTAKQ